MSWKKSELRKRPRTDVPEYQYLILAKQCKCGGTGEYSYETYDELFHNHKYTLTWECPEHSIK